MIDLRKKQYLAHCVAACKVAPRCELKRFASEELKMSPEQAQVFTPETCACVMYYMDPVDTKEGFC